MKINKFTHICAACGRQCVVTSGRAYCCPHCERLGQLISKDDLKKHPVFHDPVFLWVAEAETEGEIHKIWRCSCGEFYGGKILLDAGRAHYKNMIAAYRSEPGQALRMIAGFHSLLELRIGKEPYLELADAATLALITRVLAEESATLLHWVEDLQTQVDKLENEMPVDCERDEY